MIAGRVTMRGADGEGAPVPITEQVGDFNNVRHGLGEGFGGGAGVGAGTSIAPSEFHKEASGSHFEAGKRELCGCVSYQHSCSLA